MPDAKISALTSASTLAAADSFAVVQGGASVKATMAQVAAYPGNGGIYNTNVPASPITPVSSDTYLTGSSIAVPAGLQVGSIYRCMFYVTKTAAGVAAPVVSVRFGTNGTTADTAVCTLTFPAQSGAIDTGMFEIEAIFRTVGSGTSAVLVAVGKISHALASTGFSTSNNGLTLNASSGFNSTTAASIIGVSANGGASAVWSVTAVRAELRNVT
jgi:hypothetical protein